MGRGLEAVASPESAFFQGPRSLASPLRSKKNDAAKRSEIDRSDNNVFFTPTRLMGSLPNSSADSFACHRAFSSHHFPQFVAVEQTSEQPTLLETKRVSVSASLVLFLFCFLFTLPELHCYDSVEHPSSSETAQPHTSQVCQADCA